MNAAAFCIGAFAMWIAEILLGQVVRHFRPAKTAD